MKKILIILEAGDALPSGVVRALIFKDLFIKQGYEVNFINRLSPKLIRQFSNPTGVLGFVVSFAKKIVLNSKKEKKGIVASFISLFTRFQDKRKVAKIIDIAAHYDAVYMSKVRSLELITALKQKTKARLIMDFGDAIWLPNRHSNQFFNINDFNKTLELVDAVTTDNEFTARYARKFNANVTPYPDFPQLDAFDKCRKNTIKEKDNVITIGWIGSANTAYNLFLVWEALEEIFCRNKNLHLRLIGTGSNMDLIPQFENVHYSFVSEYNQQIMVNEVLNMDIGIFPLQNTEASKVRGILKATIYMCGEAAVVASPVGQAKEFIIDGENGMLANTKQEWIDKIETLIKNKELRKTIANKGLQSVRKNFSIDKSFNILINVIDPK